jgi:hypothetical protein
MPATSPEPKSIAVEKVLEWSREIDDVVQSLYFTQGAMNEDSQAAAIISIIAANLSKINDNIDAHSRGLTK